MNDNSLILVTGATGTLGRQVLPLLLDAGHRIRSLSRHDVPDRPGVEHTTVDLLTATGLSDAVRGVDTVLHLAGAQKGDTAGTQNLVDAATTAGVRHLVYISVVGADRVPVVSGVDRAMFGYFAEKRGAELAIERSGIPFTILRATQFHDLALLTAQTMAKLPVMPSFAGVSFQPVETAEVAVRLAELTRGEPAGLVPDLGGPRIYPMREMLRGYLTATGTRRPILSVGSPGGAARAMRAGANLTPERAVGTRTWEEFLAAHAAG
ncbi:NAD(P)H-binding protein [soil metagenome]